MSSFSLFFCVQKPESEKNNSDEPQRQQPHLNGDKTPKETKKYLTTVAPTTMPGHTGYLTFATLSPAFARGGQ